MVMGKGDRASRPDSASLGWKFRPPDEPTPLRKLAPSELSGRIVLVDTPQGRRRFLITSGPRLREGRRVIPALAVNSWGDRLDDLTYFLSDGLQAKLLRRRKLELGELRDKVSSCATERSRPERRERGFTNNEDTSNRPEELPGVFRQYADFVDADRDGHPSVNDADEIAGDNIFVDLAQTEPDDDQDDLPPGFQRADD